MALRKLLLGIVPSYFLFCLSYANVRGMTRYPSFPIDLRIGLAGRESRPRLRCVDNLEPDRTPPTRARREMPSTFNVTANVKQKQLD